MDYSSNNIRIVEHQAEAAPLQAKRVLLANAKGGCGKTTLATNLASYYARRGIATALIDNDPQGSSSHWLERRPDEVPNIHGISAFKTTPATSTRSWMMKMPRDVRRIIVDTPAGLHGNALSDQLRLADLIIIPVLPSMIDTDAAREFITTIINHHHFRGSNKQLVVMANRTRKNTRAMYHLNSFLARQELPLLGNIRDTQNYIHCAETGLGIADLGNRRGDQDINDWHELVAWLEMKLHQSPSPSNDFGSGLQSPNSVYNLSGVK
jgi:chromosome partitioning protein